MQTFKIVLSLQSFLKWASILNSNSLRLPTQILSLSVRRVSQAPGFRSWWKSYHTAGTEESAFDFSELQVSPAESIL